MASDLSPLRRASLEKRLSSIERLLPRLSGSSAEKLLLERRSLLRLLHGLPLWAELPLSFSSADLPPSSSSHGLPF